MKLHVEASSLDDFVEAYESELAERGHAELVRFVPPPEHPLRRAVLRELVRVELEHGWRQGAARSLAEYCRDWPELTAQLDDLAAVAFEEYRQRRLAGETPDPAEYERQFGIDAANWPTD
jgi:hypothetical protein